MSDVLTQSRQPGEGDRAAPTIDRVREPAVLSEEVDGVVQLTLNRPQTGNTLTAEMLDGLAREVSQLRRQQRARAVTITGSGTHFCLGGDLHDFEAALAKPAPETVDHCRERTRALAHIVTGLRGLTAPVIAAINGQAAGAGFSLALACDLRLCSSTSKLNFAYAALGASPDGGMTWLLPQVIGSARAMALLLEQPVLRAPRALSEGLVSQVTTPIELMPRAHQLAAELACAARHSVQSVKHLVHNAYGADLPSHLAREHELFAEGLVTSDMRNALVAHRAGDAVSFCPTPRPHRDFRTATVPVHHPVR